jgi:hypothetical protein
MAAGFNFVVIRAALNRNERCGRDLLWLAALAGLAINTRPSVGVSLCLGTTLLVSWAALQWHFAINPDQAIVGRVVGLAKRLGAIAGDRRIVAPIAILAFFSVVVGVVNFENGAIPSPLPITDTQFMLNFKITRSRCCATMVRSTSGACGSGHCITRPASFGS